MSRFWPVSPARCRFQHSAGAARRRLAEKLRFWHKWSANLFRGIWLQKSNYAESKMIMPRHKCHVYDTNEPPYICPGPPLPTKEYTTFVPKFDPPPPTLLADFGRKKPTPFSTEIADFEAQ